MDKLKSIVEACDILLKIGLAVAAFLFVDKAQKGFELQKQQVELQRGQAENLKLQAEHSKIQADQSKIQAEATKTLADVQSTTRKDDAALVQLIVELLFKQNLQCRTEDQMVLISFLGEMNDSYNKVKLGERVAGAFGKRRECMASQAVDDDAKLVKTSSNGKIPLVTRENIQKVLEPLLHDAEFKSAMGAAFVKHRHNGAAGYVALGRPAGDEDFVNFDLLTTKRKPNNDVPDGSLMMANVPVYLRANRGSTDEGRNPIIGQIAEHKCAEAIDAFPNTRGQTWALVKLADCPEVKKKKGDG
jgi:hypothetical protein